MAEELKITKTVVFDLDGTLSDDRHRLDRINDSWDDYHARCTFDKPYQSAINLARMYGEKTDVVICTGRPEAFYAYTEDWLANQGVFPVEILMRPKWNSMPTTTMKLGLLLDYFDWCPDKVPEPNEEGTFLSSKIEAIFEDRRKLVEYWRELGIDCYQPREGDI